MFNYNTIVFVSLFAVLVGSVACHNVTPKQEIAAEQEDNINSNNNQNTMPVQKQDKWKFYFQESDNEAIMAQFEKANQIVLKNEHFDGKIEDASEYLNNWFILRYPKQKSKRPQVADKSDVLTPVYIVDLDAEKVISRDDVQAILPIYKNLLQGIIDNPTKQDRYIKRMVTLTSIVAFSHERYDNPTLEFVPATPDVATLRYDIQPTDSSIIYKHCELVINKDAVELHISEQPRE